MIKILHTADLHLGRLFYDLDLRDDQEFMLKQLGEILAREPWHALIIAGDVYDRSIPSPEAVGLLGSFLAEVKARRPSPEIFIISGNHDSPARLGFGRELFAKLGIHLAINPENCDKPIIIEDPESKDRSAFFLLPFLNSGGFRLLPGAGSTQEETPAEKSGKAGDLGEAGGQPFLSGWEPPSPRAGTKAGDFRGKAVLAAAEALENSRRRCISEGAAFSVLAAHLFAAGGAESDSERIFLGSAEKTDAALFKGFDYVALGHLHRCQQIVGNCWYSGSPLAYSFGEAGREKFFLHVELERSSGPVQVKVEKIPVKPRWKVTSLSGPFSRFFKPLAEDGELLGAREDYLEICLEDREPVENSLALLRPRFPRLLTVKQRAAFSVLLENAAFTAPEALSSAERERRDTADDFRDFLISLYGEADSAKMELFREFLLEAQEEEETR